MQEWICDKAYFNDNKTLTVVIRNSKTGKSKNISWPWINVLKRIEDKTSLKEKDLINGIDEILKQWDGVSSIIKEIENKFSFNEKNNKNCLLEDLQNNNFIWLTDSISMDNNETLYSEELKELRQKIQWYNDNYSYLRQTAENWLQDVRLETLKELCPQDPLLKVVNSDLSSSLPKVKHQVPMLSLEKITADKEKLKKWCKKFKTDTIICQPKLDGHSLSLHYKNWKHVLSATRWNKVEWNDVTINSRYVRGVKLEINDKRDIEIRGETILKNSDFEHLKDIFENVRNAISIASVKDPKDLENKRLSFIAYNLFVDGQSIQDEEEKFAMLKSLWFEVPYIIKFNKNDSNKIDEILEEFELYRKEDSPLNYQIDWIVFKVNSFKEQQEVWENDHDPNWAVAYKYLAEEKWAILEDVEWTVSKNWNVIPVGLLKPIQLSWTTVSRVTLHHRKFLEENLVLKGDEILIRKSWEIIPYFIENISALKRIAEHSRKTIEELKMEINKLEVEAKNITLKEVAYKYGYTENLEEQPIPKKCPDCNTDLTTEDIHLNCSNENCIGRNKKTITHMVESLEIDSLWEWIINKLFNSKVITKPEDIFDLTIEKLTWIEWFQEKLINKILYNIEDVKSKVTVERVLKSVWLDSLGERKAKQLLWIYGTIRNLVDNIKKEDLLKEPWFAELSSEYYASKIKEQGDLIKIISDKIWVLDKEFDNWIKENKLNWATFCITGTLSRNRADVEKDIISFGWKIAGVTKNLNYLICWTWWWSKFDKAEEINSKFPWVIKIITEEDFNGLIK